jgi:predicted metal-dependent peptidase
MDDRIEAKLTAARAWLIIDKPFLGALVLRLPLVEADPRWCRSTATDAKSLYYNRDYIDQLTFEQTKFALAHEALHCALAHFARREHRHKRRWDIACDLAINPALVADGLQPAPNALVLDGFADMAAEEIYPYVQENSDQEPHDQHVYDDSGDGGGRAASGDGMDAGGRATPGAVAGTAAEQSQEQPHTAPPPSEARASRPKDETGSSSATDTNEPPRKGADTGRAGTSQPPPLSATERETLAQQWQQRLAGAAQQAMRAGKFGGSVARLVEHLLQPQLPWRMLLARYLTSMARDDYSFLHPSRREGAAILPGLRSIHVDIVVALDTSGSIANEEMREFLSEANAIKGQVGARITLLACDEALAPDAPWVFEPWDEVRLPESLPGGGGTRFTPVFDWVARQDRRPDLLVYFTDAKGEFPAEAPPYPVLWLVKGKAKVPWGQRIQLN